jgi:hypothetical protein
LSVGESKDPAPEAIANDFDPNMAARAAESSMTNNRTPLISRRGSILELGNIIGSYLSY